MINIEGQKAIDEMRATVSASLLTNAKLAQALGVMMDYHLSTQEKVSVSKRIDACKNMEELNGTMVLLDLELKKGYMDPQTGDRWSPIFVNDIKRYYENGFPFNPLEEISSLMKNVKDYIVFSDMTKKLEDGPAKELMVKELDEKRLSCGDSLQKLDTIFSELRSGQ